MNSKFMVDGLKWKDLNQQKKDNLIILLTVFVKYFTKKWEKKLEQYLQELEPNGTTKKPKLWRDTVDWASIIPVPYLKNLIGAIGKVIPFSSIRKEILKGKYREKTLRETLVKAAGYIFWSYQNQFIHVTDINKDDEIIGMQKLANDAVDQMFNYTDPENKLENLEPHIQIAISAIFGPQKKLGQTIKYNGSICSTRRLYKNISILKMDVAENYVINLGYRLSNYDARDLCNYNKNGGRLTNTRRLFKNISIHRRNLFEEYVKYITNDINFGYRLSSNDEACDLSSYYKSGSLNEVKEIISIEEMEPLLEVILNKINDEDTVLLQQTTKKNTEKIITATTKINQNVENIFGLFFLFFFLKYIYFHFSINF